MKMNTPKTGMYREHYKYGLWGFYRNYILSFLYQTKLLRDMSTNRNTPLIKFMTLILMSWLNYTGLMAQTYPGNFSSPVTLDGTNAITDGSFSMNPADTDVSEIASSLTAGTTYDVYLFLEDTIGNQREIYQIDDITTVSPYMVPFEERDALIALYNATNGASWNTNTNWLTEEPVDTWFGITVVGGHITEIDLDWTGNNLNGTLPIELGDLNFLEKISMPRNPNLTGNIVSELFTNLSLTEIDLANNGLSGNIPSNISNLTALQFLELDNNGLSGSIPSGIYTLSNLEVLDLSNNNISGPISTDIQNLTLLTNLSLGDNPIGGTIPIEIGNLINLTNLNIYRANLTGSIPTEVGNLINLQYITLGRNGLTGSIPPSLGNLNQVINFFLDNNNLSGSIPSSLGNLTNVKLFILSHNLLSGSIPLELGMLTNVTSFYLNNNNLSGSIPPELGGLTSVTQLYLNFNQLEGVIPVSLATLPNVNDIFFFNNNFSGTLPDFTQAPNLGYRILLQNNAFQFGDFENQWNAYQIQLNTFRDSPQARVNLEETITVNVGDNTTLTTTVSGSQNNYQWYKNNTLITGATSSNLILNPTQLTDAGDYHCIITSNIVTDLTLRRNFIHLIVTPVPDTEAPVISCPSDQELACNTTSIPDYTGLAEVTDNQDPNPVLTQNPLSGTAFTDGMTISIIATDASNNSDNCTFVVTTTADTEAPVVICPSDQNLAAGSTIPDYTSLVTVTDNCDTSFTIDQSPVVGTLFTNGMTITMTVTDSSSNVGDCTFIITETPDTEAPVITCPSDQELACNTASIPDYTGLAAVTDNQDPNPVLTQSPAAGTTFTDGMTISIIATDASNNTDNCTFVVTTTADTEDPIISCPSDQVLASGNVLPDYTSLATVTDNCTASPVVTQIPISGGTYTPGMTITLIATDNIGNTANCTFIVNEGADTDAPVITCPSDQELACSTTSIPDYTGLAAVTDNQDPNPVLTQSPAAGTAFTDGMTISIIATDATGNSDNCTFIVNTTADTEDPIISCPSDQVLASGNVLPDYTSLATVTDNCTISPVVTQTPILGGTYTPGMTITLIATDNIGNTANCTFIVNEGADTEAPVITCPSDQELVCNTTSIPDYTELAAVTDNQDPNPVLTQSPVAGTTFTDGMTISIIATDATGNTDNCTFIVNTTADTEDPIIFCPSDQVLASGNVLPDYTSLATVTDNCTVSPVVTQTPIPGGTYTPEMTITLIATDDIGNTANCTFIVNETPDTEAPVISCPSDKELLCNTVSIPDYTGLAVVTDNQDPNPVLTQSPLAGTAFTDGMTISIIATDATGNTDNCTFIINTQTVSVDAGVDEEINEGQEVQLNASATDMGTFLWSPSIGLDDPTISNPIAKPTQTTDYTVVFTSIDGCKSEDYVTVYVKTQQPDDTKYGFSPDNDGINEFWEIGSIEKYPNNRVLIYNRWGDLVFEIEGYNNTSSVFRGIANRKRNLGADELPEGTYFFDIKIEGTHTLQKLNGFLVLKR